MKTVKLTVPKQTEDPGATAFVQPERLKRWVASLPLGNAEKTGRELLSALYHVNRAVVPAEQRFHLLEHFGDQMTEALVALEQRCLSFPVPHNDKQHPITELVRKLWVESAYGYKALVLHHAGHGRRDIPDVLLVTAYRAADVLSRLLVHTYSLYQSEPRHVWLELHQLYRFADERDFLTKPVPGIGRSLDQAYRRIVLLSLANPYHLMQGEAAAVFAELEGWTGACRVLPLSPHTLPRGQLYVDLERDLPPCYASARVDVPPPLDGRVLDISAVMGVVNRRLKETLDLSKGSNGRLSLGARKQRNMYKRLGEAWALRPERLSERNPERGHLELAVGLSSCHHFIEDGAPFMPEESELRLRSQGRVGRAGPALSLLPDNDAPWVNEDQARRLNAGIVLPRTSRFGAEPGRDSKDIWLKVYSQSAGMPEQAGTPVAHRLAVCERKDSSRGGLGMICQAPSGMAFRVGEMIAFRSPGTAEGRARDSEWVVGTVRWLNVGPRQNLDLGVRQLADDALAVATKGVSGVGQGGEYFRALVIPKLDPMQYPTTLIVPAAAYDVDSVVLVNTGAELFHARLTKLLEATDGYARYQFVLVEPPKEMPREVDPGKIDRYIS
ncbi:MAG TPA: hypothetical protein ENJ19_10680 [Gammaproteobacteria bacterium]|nr:hypothetical protein [Gammaproteobacteria bacterium]